MKEETYRRPTAGDHPPNLSPDYKSTAGRAPTKPAIALPHSLSEITGPLLASERLDAHENDLTKQRMAEPLGERIIVQGRVLDEDGKPVPGALVEIWQCNAAGRYHHPGDQHDAPLDPNFYGGGRARADAEGQYKFITIKPGAYPWKNHHNAWRPAHIHFSLFGPAFADAADHADVLPQRSAARLRPDLQLGARRGARAPAGVVRDGPDAARMGAGLPFRHRAARPQRHADGVTRMADIDNDLILRSGPQAASRRMGNSKTGSHPSRRGPSARSSATVSRVKRLAMAFCPAGWR